MKTSTKIEADELLPQELGADGHFSGVESDPEEVSEPFDPDQISIEPKGVPMDTFIRRFLQGNIRLAPAYQRKEVWDIERKSRLIESMMLKIPLPMFYVAADEKGNWDVVDGLQRLSTFRDFVLGRDYVLDRKEPLRGHGFKLKGLEFWGEKFDGETFASLPEIMQNRILETEFRFTIINPGTPEEVKRNIFKRINTGGMPLTAQEIRHALYQGTATSLLEELINTDDFKDATNETIDDSRMAAREVVLRFLAFSICNYKNFARYKSMDTFLSDSMRIINLMPGLKTDELKKIFKGSVPPEIVIRDVNALRDRFKNAMIRANKIFSDHAFRKSYGDKRRSPINKTLFEVWGNLLADMSEDEFNNLKKHKLSMLKEYNVMLENPNFINLMSRDSWKPYGVRARYEVLTQLLGEYMQWRVVC